MFGCPIQHPILTAKGVGEQCKSVPQPDPTLNIGGAVACLTPGGAFRLAEQLIRGATRQMSEDECSTTEGAGSLPAGHEAPMIELVTLVGWNAGAWKSGLRGQSIRICSRYFSTPRFIRRRGSYESMGKHGL